MGFIGRWVHDYKSYCCYNYFYRSKSCRKHKCLLCSNRHYYRKYIEYSIVQYNMESYSNNFHDIYIRRSSFSSAQTRNAGTNHSIEIGSVTPIGATYSPISLSRSIVGTSSLTSFGTGNYQGSFTSPVLTLV